MDLQQLELLLSNLSSAGPARQAAEELLDSSLSSSPAQVLSGLVQLGSNATEEVNRILALIILRRLAFRPTPGPSTVDPLSNQVWDVIDEQTRAGIQAGLLAALVGSATKREKERSGICDTIAEIERAGLSRGIPWPALSTTLAALFASPALTLREATFRIYAEVPSLLESETGATIVAGLTAGLRDTSPGVRLAALAASVSLIGNAEVKEIPQYKEIVAPMLDILPPFANERSEGRLAAALISLIDLASTPKVPSRILKPHLPTLVSFCLSILAPSPFQTSPSYSQTAFDEAVRHPALEVLLSIAETAPSMTKSYPEFAIQLVPVLLDMMGERVDDAEWIYSQDFDDDDHESSAVIAEGAIDRLSQTLGSVVFAPTIQRVSELMSSPHWQHRHAALSSIASIAEGCADETRENMRYLLGIVLQGMKDDHPRVRYAAIYAIGQLCTDGEGALQEEHGREVLQALIVVCGARESRLQAYTASCLVNFFQTGAPECIQDLLPTVFASLVKLLTDGENFVKEHALEAMSLLAGSMQTDFTPLYSSIMPQLLNVLENASDESLIGLRARALDCASGIADAVEATIFAPDAARLLAAMHNIQNGITEDDEITLRYLLRAYSGLAATVGADTFAPYVANVLPHLVAEASKKPEITVGEDQDEEEWETVEVDGKQVAIRTAALEEKLEAVNNLVILIQALGSSLPVAALHGLLEIAVPLLKFYYHIEVRESAAALLSITLQAISQSLTPQEQLKAILCTVSDAFADCIAGDTDAEILSTFIVSWTSCFIILPGCLSVNSRETYLKALESQLTSLRDREIERLEVVEDADDALAWDDVTEEDARVFNAISRSIGAMLKADRQSFPIEPFMPFLGLLNGASAPPTHFALRLVYDTIQSMGDRSPSLVQPYLQTILKLLSNDNPDTRGLASSIIAEAAESNCFPDFCIAAVEPLFLSIGPLDMEDNAAIVARDNSISALARIIRIYGDGTKIDIEPLLPRWIASLPALLDGEEFQAICSLFMELIAREHACVSPTSPGISHHVVKCLVSFLQSEVLQPSLVLPLAHTLKSYLATMADGLQLSAQLPEDVKRIL